MCNYCKKLILIFFIAIMPQLAYPMELTTSPETRLIISDTQKSIKWETITPKPYRPFNYTSLFKEYAENKTNHAFKSFKEKVKEHTTILFKNRLALIPKKGCLEKQDIKKLSKYLSLNANPNCILDTGETPLTFSVKFLKNERFITFLLDHKANSNTPNVCDETPFSIVINEILENTTENLNVKKILTQLLQHGANIDAYIDGKTALIKAIEKENTILFDFLLENKANVNILTQGNQKNALHFALEKVYASKGQNDMQRYMLSRLINKGASIDNPEIMSTLKEYVTQDSI